MFVPAAIDDAGLSVHAFRLYARICRRWSPDEGCYESAASMARACRMKRDTVFIARSELVDVGLVTLTERPGETTRIDVVLGPEGSPSLHAPNGAGLPPQTSRVSEGAAPRNGTGGQAPKTGRGVPPQTGRPPVPRNGTQRYTPEGVP